RKGSANLSSWRRSDVSGTPSKLTEPRAGGTTPPECANAWTCPKQLRPATPTALPARCPATVPEARECRRSRSRRRAVQTMAARQLPALPDGKAPGQQEDEQCDIVPHCHTKVRQHLNIAAEAS